MLRAMLFYKGLPVNRHVSALVGMDMVVAVIVDIAVGEGNILAVPEARRAAFAVVDFGACDGHSGAEAGIDSDDTAAKEGAILYRDFIRPVKSQHISGAAAQTVNMSCGKAIQGDAGSAL